MDRERIKDRIKEFAARPKNVRYGELETLLDNHIKHLVENFNHHGKESHRAFTVGAEYIHNSRPKTIRAESLREEFPRCDGCNRVVRPRGQAMKNTPALSSAQLPKGC